MVQVVRSETVPELIYSVDMHAGTGRACGCSCPSRQYRPGIACKHMRGVDVRLRSAAIGHVRDCLADIAASTGGSCPDDDEEFLAAMFPPLTWEVVPAAA